MREELKNFYSVIKDCDEYVKFVFLTGVSKFSKVSIFSGLNNLKDITTDERYATICGYTQNDLEMQFEAYLAGCELDELKKKYYEKYLSTAGKIYLIGIEFSKDEKNISGYEWELVQQA